MNSINSNIFYSILFLTISSAITSCHTSSRQIQRHVGPILKVGIGDLVRNVGKYNNLVIETEGIIHHGYEEIAIYSPQNYLQNGDTIKSIDLSNGIWIQSTLRYPESESFYDSLQNKIVKVIGLFDTTKTGHLGNYRGTLVRTEFKLNSN